MNTLIAVIFILAIVGNVFMYKKAEYVWNSEAAQYIVGGVVLASFILAATVALDLGLADTSDEFVPNFPLWFAINLGLVSLASFGFSIYDGYDFEI